VCFRQPEDAFFVLYVEGPLFDKVHYNAALKKMVPDVGATSDAYGWMTAFVNGISDASAAPLHWFSGQWTPLLGVPGFKARLGDTQTATDDNDSSIIYIDSSQVDARVKYKNRVDKNVEYRLLIQRSIGRFVERYAEPPSQVPFLEQNGRCAVIPDTP